MALSCLEKNSTLNHFCVFYNPPSERERRNKARSNQLQSDRNLDLIKKSYKVQTLILLLLRLEKNDSFFLYYLPIC